MDMKEYKQSINPYGVPHADMKIGKRVLVDIPINHDGDHAEVEGIISRDLWIGSPNCIYSQVKITMQNTQRDKVMLSAGDLYAIYPDKIKKMLN